MKVERDAKGFTERGWIEFGFRNYYALLDCGFRLRPTAGTASGVHPVPLGFGRVYVRLDGGLDERAWLAGLDAGGASSPPARCCSSRSTGTTPGTASCRPTRRPASTACGARPSARCHWRRIEVVINGEVARTIRPANRETERAYESPIDEALTLDGTSWVAVRCFEDRPDGRVRFAHSGPFHVDVAGRPLRPRRAEVEYLVHRVRGPDRPECRRPPPAGAR